MLRAHSANDNSLKRRAALHAALAEPHRLAIVDALRLSDRTASALARRIAIDSNLMAHHVQVLVDAGLVERRVSSGDRRRRYLHLSPDTLSGLLASPRIEAGKVLFVCTGNSARSQFAAALWTQVFGRHGSSAGTHPAERVHPLAIQIAQRHGLDLTSAAPRPLPESDEGLLVTVCDQAHEELAGSRRAGLHWSVPDPARTGTLAAFEEVYGQIQRQVESLAAHTTSPSRAPDSGLHAVPR